MVWPIMSGRRDSGCNSKDVRKPSQRGTRGTRGGTRERGKSAIRSFILLAFRPLFRLGGGMDSPYTPFDQMMEMTQTHKQLFMEPASQERRLPLIPLRTTARDRRREQVRSAPKLRTVGYSSV